MRYYLLFILFSITFHCGAQERIVSTNSITIEGDIKQPLAVTIADLKKYPVSFTDSIPVYNHLMARKSALRKVKGVSLKELLSKVEITSPGPKELSRYYITCMASDGYAVVFSWNELFNTAIGDKVLVIVSQDGQDIEQLKDRIALISSADRATGRRYVKGLKRVVIKHI